MQVLQETSAKSLRKTETLLPTIPKSRKIMILPFSLSVYGDASSCMGSFKKYDTCKNHFFPKPQKVSVKPMIWAPLRVSKVFLAFQSKTY